MFEIRFGVQVDMSSLSAFIDDMVDLVGELDDVEEQESDKIVWDTDTGMVVTIRGDFNSSGAGEAERIEVHTGDHELVMSAFDFNDTTESAHLMDDDGIEFVLEQIDEGVSLIGSRFNDILNGGEEDDILSGAAGADILNGRAGNDELRGAAGNDTYVIDGSTEIDKTLADQGVDMVKTPLTYALGAEQENLTLLGTLDLNGTGNTKVNVIWGNAGDNTLTGSGGGDTLHGREGEDLLRGQDGNDTLNGAQGDDTLNGSAGNDAANGAAGADILDGGSGIDTLVGGAGNDDLKGSAGTDELRGQDGSDRMDGGANADELIGGKGADVFRFNDLLGSGNVDTIGDFGGAGIAAIDLIDLENAVFGGLTAGSLSDAAFQSGTGNTADAADVRIIYNSETGALFYDADGSGGASSAVRFAVLATSPDNLSADDFVVT